MITSSTYLARGRASTTTLIGGESMTTKSASSLACSTSRCEKSKDRRSAMWSLGRLTATTWSSEPSSTTGVRACSSSAVPWARSSVP